MHNMYLTISECTFSFLGVFHSFCLVFILHCFRLYQILPLLNTFSCVSSFLFLFLFLFSFVLFYYLSFLSWNSSFAAFLSFFLSFSAFIFTSFSRFFFYDISVYHFCYLSFLFSFSSSSFFFNVHFHFPLFPPSTYISNFSRSFSFCSSIFLPFLTLTFSSPSIFLN